MRLLSIGIYLKIKNNNYLSIIALFPLDTHSQTSPNVDCAHKLREQSSYKNFWNLEQTYRDTVHPQISNHIDLICKVHLAWHYYQRFLLHGTSAWQWLSHAGAKEIVHRKQDIIATILSKQTRGNLMGQLIATPGIRVHLITTETDRPAWCTGWCTTK